MASLHRSLCKRYWLRKMRRARAPRTHTFGGGAGGARAAQSLSSLFLHTALHGMRIVGPKWLWGAQPTPAQPTLCLGPRDRQHLYAVCLAPGVGQYLYALCLGLGVRQYLYALCCQPRRDSRLSDNLKHRFQLRLGGSDEQTATGVVWV